MTERLWRELLYALDTLINTLRGYVDGELLLVNISVVKGNTQRRNQGPRFANWACRRFPYT